MEGEREGGREDEGGTGRGGDQEPLGLTLIGTDCQLGYQAALGRDMDTRHGTWIPQHNEILKSNAELWIPGQGHQPDLTILIPE